MTIFSAAIGNMTLEDAEKSARAHDVLGELMREIGDAESERLLVPNPNAWDVRALLSGRAVGVWDNREAKGEDNPRYEIVPEQPSRDPRNSIVSHAKLDNPTGALTQDSFIPLLLGPLAAILFLSFILLFTGDEGIVAGIALTLLGIPLYLFGFNQYLKMKDDRSLDDPNRYWYTDTELDVELSSPLWVEGDSVELKLMKVVSLIRDDLPRLRAWQDGTLEDAKIAFNLDFEALKLLAQVGAIVKHGQWIADYARVQETRGMLDETDIQSRVEENNNALTEAINKTAELLSLYYSVSALSERIDAEEELQRLQTDSRESSLMQPTADGALELSHQVDRTHDAFNESVLTVVEKAERLISHS